MRANGGIKGVSSSSEVVVSPNENHFQNTVIKFPLFELLKRQKKRSHIETEEKNIRLIYYLLLFSLFAVAGGNLITIPCYHFNDSFFSRFQTRAKLLLFHVFSSINCGYAVSHPLKNTILDIRVFGSHAERCRITIIQQLFSIFLFRNWTNLISVITWLKTSQNAE